MHLFGLQFSVLCLRQWQVLLLIYYFGVGKKGLLSLPDVMEEDDNIHAIHNRLDIGA